MNSVEAPHSPLFSRALSALLTAVAETPDEDFALPSGCAGWLVRDLVCHLVIDAQDVLITLATPAETEPTADADSYWRLLVEAPTGDAPLDALVPRLAAAYGDPALLRAHLDDVGSAAGRAARLADPAARVGTQEMVLTVEDFLSSYVLEWTLHHLDLVAHRPTAPGPAAEPLSAARAALERLAGAAFPATLTDADALTVATGRRPPTEAERETLGDLAARLPLVLS
ncbi:maleylpyruvate isomerase N-terminal domain-containing protein [Streptomyces zhaozhouensis]|uniref:maleylpyruvate isomerase N-terminal domain-containing protein n=1 Tax=Streptomyces zhaozhouensis TaxID=1300267 RepID=UPI001FE81D61|nr:maleylpyruvate isomerase N-terminal domain-containing protein [Streptomyces zhaozhouensis]